MPDDNDDDCQKATGETSAKFQLIKKVLNIAEGITTLSIAPFTHLTISNGAPYEAIDYNGQSTNKNVSYSGTDVSNWPKLTLRKPAIF